MKISYKVTYDAGKLANEMNGMVWDYIGKMASAYERGSKDAIAGGGFKKIQDSTKMVREKGLSPNANRKKSGSIKPLEHTGRLKRSIKAQKRSIKFNRYGLVHLKRHKIKYSSFAKKIGFIGKDVEERLWFKADKEMLSKSYSTFKKNLKKNFKK